MDDRPPAEQPPQQVQYRRLIVKSPQLPADVEFRLLTGDSGGITSGGDTSGGDTNELGSGTTPLPPTCTVGQLKQRISERLDGVSPPHMQRLVFAGRLLNDDGQMLRELGHGSEGNTLLYPLVLHLALMQRPAAAAAATTTTPSTTSAPHSTAPRHQQPGVHIDTASAQARTGTTGPAADASSPFTPLSTSAAVSNHSVTLGLPGISAPIVVVDGMPYLVIPGTVPIVSPQQASVHLSPVSPGTTGARQGAAGVIVGGHGHGQAGGILGPGALHVNGGADRRVVYQYRVGGAAAAGGAQPAAEGDGHAHNVQVIRRQRRIIRQRVPLFELALPAFNVQQFSVAMWTLAKYLFFVYLFGAGGRYGGVVAKRCGCYGIMIYYTHSTERFLLMHVIAFIVYLVQSGRLDSVGRWFRGLAMPAPPAAQHQQAVPQQQRQERRSELTGYMRSAVSMLVAFFGSLIPGVDEAIIAGHLREQIAEARPAVQEEPAVQADASVDASAEAPRPAREAPEALSSETPSATGTADADTMPSTTVPTATNVPPSSATSFASTTATATAPSSSMLAQRRPHTSAHAEVPGGDEES